MARPSITPIQSHANDVAESDKLSSLINRIQAVVFSALTYLFGLPLNQGHVIVSNVLLSTTKAKIRHGLGRKLQGVMVVHSSAQATVIDAPSTLDPLNNVDLTASATTTVNLLFF